METAEDLLRLPQPLWTRPGEWQGAGEGVWKPSPDGDWGHETPAPGYLYRYLHTVSTARDISRYLHSVSTARNISRHLHTVSTAHRATQGIYFPGYVYLLPGIYQDIYTMYLLGT